MRRSTSPQIDSFFDGGAILVSPGITALSDAVIEIFYQRIYGEASQYLICTRMATL